MRNSDNVTERRRVTKFGSWQYLVFQGLSPHVTAPQPIKCPKACDDADAKRNITFASGDGWRALYARPKTVSKIFIIPHQSFDSGKKTVNMLCSRVGCPCR
ncbi:hypothetical protein FKM82_023767 [Ascaphus truei]